MNLDNKCNRAVCSHQCERYESCKNTWDATLNIPKQEYKKLHHVLIFIDDDKDPLFSMTYLLNDKKAEDRIDEVMAKCKKYYGSFPITKIDMEVGSILTTTGSCDP